MPNRLMVTLQSSDNTYLKYPCSGELELFEIGVHGRIINAVFRGKVEGSENKLHCPVVVKNPVFVYPAITTLE